MTFAEFEQLVLSFSGVELVSHFNRIGFKVKDKKMISTYIEKDNTANIFLTPKEQEHFCTLRPTHIYPVPNKWGEKGATTFEIEYLNKDIIRQALEITYQNVTCKTKSE